MSERLCVVMPVYNEQDVVGSVLASWTAQLEKLGLDFVIRPYNDGSRDSSLAVMREVAKGSSRLEVRDKPNSGHGPTILKAYREAACDGFDWIFQVDSDNEMSPDSFEDFWRRRTSFDFLVGRRAGRVQALARKIVSLVSRLAVRMFYGKGEVWDVNAPYRLMRVAAFGRLFDLIPSDTFAPNVLLTGLAARFHLRSCELTVPQRDRQTGTVSIRKWKLFKASVRSLCQTLRFAWSLKRRAVEESIVP